MEIETPVNLSVKNVPDEIVQDSYRFGEIIRTDREKHGARRRR